MQITKGLMKQLTSRLFEILREGKEQFPIFFLAGVMSTLTQNELIDPPKFLILQQLIAQSLDVARIGTDPRFVTIMLQIVSGFDRFPHLVDKKFFTLIDSTVRARVKQLDEKGVSTLDQRDLPSLLFQMLRVGHFESIKPLAQLVLKTLPFQKDLETRQLVTITNAMPFLLLSGIEISKELGNLSV